MLVSLLLLAAQPDPEWCARHIGAMHSQPIDMAEGLSGEIRFEVAGSDCDDILIIVRVFTPDGRMDIADIASWQSINKDGPYEGEDPVAQLGHLYNPHMSAADALGPIRENGYGGFTGPHEDWWVVHDVPAYNAARETGGPLHCWQVQYEGYRCAWWDGNRFVLLGGAY